VAGDAVEQPLDRFAGEIHDEALEDEEGGELRGEPGTLQALPEVHVFQVERDRRDVTGHRSEDAGDDVGLPLQDRRPIDLEDAHDVLHGIDAVRPRVVAGPEDDHLGDAVACGPLRDIVEVPDPCADGVAPARRRSLELRGHRPGLGRMVSRPLDLFGIDEVDRERVEEDAFVLRQLRLGVPLQRDPLGHLSRAFEGPFRSLNSGHGDIPPPHIPYLTTNILARMLNNHRFEIPGGILH
jgi:hypothetical protein